MRALASLRAAADLSPEDGELDNLIGAALLATDDLPQALVCFERAEEKGSQYGMTNKGICLWRLDRQSEAVAALTQAVQRAPDDLVPRQNLNAVLASGGIP